MQLEVHQHAEAEPSDSQEVISARDSWSALSFPWPESTESHARGIVCSCHREVTDLERYEKPTNR